MNNLKSSNPNFIDNTDSILIIVAPSKLDNLLRDFEERTKYYRWFFFSVGMFLTVIVSVVTSDFRDILGIPKAGWQGAFVVSLIFSFFASIYFLVKVFRGGNLNRAELIKRLTTIEYKVEGKKEKKQKFI